MIKGRTGGREKIEDKILKRNLAVKIRQIEKYFEEGLESNRFLFLRIREI